MPKRVPDIRNYPFSAGTTHAKRKLPALKEVSYVQLDERKMEDFLMFAQRFSSYIKYFNKNNEQEFDWSGFLNNDVSFQIAAFSILDLNAYNKVWKKLSEDPEGSAQVYFTQRFDFLYQVIYLLTLTYHKNISYPDYANTIFSLCSSAEIGMLYKLTNQYWKAAEDATLLATVYSNFKYNDIEIEKSALLKKKLENTDYIVFLSGNETGIADGNFIFGNAGSNEGKIKNAWEYLNFIAEALLKLMGSAIDIAKSFFTNSLEVFNTHKPHVALFLTYLRLQQEFQIQYNTILIKHLDFYYKEVLLLSNKKYHPDELFVYFELAKNQATYLLEQGTLLKAGKDSGGKDVYYQLQEQILLNKSQVAALKSFTYIATDSSSNRPKGLFAADVANSADGKGKALADQEAWTTYRTATDHLLDTGIGFSFVSQILREVSAGAAYNLYIHLSINLLPADVNLINNYVKVLLHADNGTEEASNIVITATGGNILKISFTAGNSKTKIVSEGPSASVILKANSTQQVNTSFLVVISKLKSAHISRLEVELFNQMVEDFFIDTPLGSADPKEGFYPFGSSPKQYNDFIISSPLFTKRKLRSFNFSGELKEQNVAEIAMDVFLDANNTNNNFNASDTFVKEHKHLLSNTKSFAASINIFPDTIHSGKVKFFLNQSLGHENYTKNFTDAVIQKQKAANPSSVEFPAEPYTPFFKNCTLKITASEEISLTDQLFHKYPFGYAAISNGNKFIPALDTEGELYIGIKDANIGESFSLLIQLNEGSANPDLDLADTKWYYLSNNQWKLFPDNVLHDSTDKFTRSGLIKGSWPNDISSNTTLFEEQLFWIKLTVAKNNVDAVCNIIGIHTQAVQAKFIDKENEKNYLGTNVEKGFVAALYPKVGAVKSVTQPYESFNGRKTEPDDVFYIRSAERLRHKNKAITQWDIEHLLIQEFPELYKVKCLTHAKKEINGTIISNPGYIIVTALPFTKDVETDRRFMPKLNKAVLRKMEEYIKKRLSPFVTPQILNADFEEVLITIDCVFADHINDKNFYVEQLQQEIQHYLSPWLLTNSSEDLLFDKAIYKAAVLDFIEERDYVDYITKLEMAHGGKSNKDEAVPVSPIGILTSAKAHTITAKLAAEMAMVH